MVESELKSLANESNLVLTDAPSSLFNVDKWQGINLSQVNDCLAEEVPIALVYNGISHAVMLATPQDLEDFALGFSLSEGILQNRHELYGVEVKFQENGIELNCEISAESFYCLKERRRSLVGRTGCGLCGAENLAQALRLPTKKNLSEKSNKVTANVVKESNIHAAYRSIAAQQTLQIATGATHACAWINEDGELKLVREDVGRHNAMDKLVGAMAQAQLDGQGFVLTTSRASYEMIQKVASAGLNALVAISAPTGLAVRMAQQYGVTLIGFLRKNQYVVYTYPERIERSNN